MTDFVDRRVGIGGFIGWGEESSFGSATSASHYLQIAPGDETFQLDQEFLEASHTVERGVDTADVVKGMKAVSGTWSHDLRYGGGWGLLLEHLLFDESADAGAGPYTHTLSVGDYASGMAGKGLSFIVARDGLLVSGSDVADRYYGCRPTACTITCEDNAIARAEWTLIGAGHDTLAIPTPSYPTDNFIKAPSDASSPTAGFKYGTDASEDTYPCRRWSVTISQGWDPVRVLQAPEMSEPTLAGRLEVTISAEVLFQGTGASGDAFTTNYRAGTPKSLILTLEGPTAASESLVLDFPNVRLTSPPDPHMTETGAIYQSLEFKAYRSGATMEGTMTLTNSDATIG